jgi:hypothetical protein
MRAGIPRSPTEGSSVEGAPTDGKKAPMPRGPRSSTEGSSVRAPSDGNEAPLIPGVVIRCSPTEPAPQPNLLPNQPAPQPRVVRPA